MGRSEARDVVIAHVTDAHVTESGRRNAALKDESVTIFDDLIDQIVERKAELTLFGGDNIDNHGDGENDLAVFTRISSRVGPYLCTVGNHESVAPRSGYLSKQQFAAKLPGHGMDGERFCFSHSVGNVRAIGIDTTLVGTAGGYVAPAMMRFLAEELRCAEEEHIVVLGHHLLYRSWEPLTLHAWDKDYLVANREAVIALLASHPRVRAYLCGHHHASRIQRIAARGASGGFYHILTASPVSYPHNGRVLTFAGDGIHVESIRPRRPDLIELGRIAVQSGRKAQRFEMLGSQRTFLQYVGGRTSDNDVVLPYEHAPVSISPRSAELLERRRAAV